MRLKDRMAKIWPGEKFSIKKFKNRFQKGFTRFKTQLKKRPFLYFGIVLSILLVLIIAGNLIRKPAVEEAQKPAPKQVQLYTIGQAPTLNFQGKVEKSGTVVIQAQMAGIISQVNVGPGQQVYQGQNLIQLSSNYTGANIPALQAQLASNQYEFNKNNLDGQKEIIEKQKQIAKETWENSQELRDLTEDSISETQSQLDLNQSILDTIENNLQTLEQATNSAANQDLILSTKQLKAQFLSAVNQLKSMLRSNQYQADEDNPPANLTDLQKELSLKQLDIQEKSLELSLEVSRLNWLISSITASFLHPSAPFAGVVEKIHVYTGQYVNPGQPLLTITGNTNQLDVVISISPNLINQVSSLEPAIIFLPESKVELMPQHKTLAPLSDQLHRLIYHLPINFQSQVFDGQYLTVQLPIGYADSVASIPSIPIDSVYQLQDQAFVYIMEDNTAFSREVSLGKVYGSYVEVLSCLSSGDKLILSRNVTQGDKVKEQGK
jgi:multidrug efflux pump subunit AcrA (membrane-fusion protein)